MSEAGKRLIESARQALEYARGTANTSEYRVREYTNTNPPKESKSQHVIKRDNGWAVRGEGNKKDTTIAPTQKEAIERAIEIARNNSSEVIIHGRDGRVRDTRNYSKRSYSTDEKKIV